MFSLVIHGCNHGCVGSHIMLSSVGLQHSREEAVGEGEAGEPEHSGRLDRLYPVCKLTDPLAKIPGPRCQGLQ